MKNSWLFWLMWGVIYLVIALGHGWCQELPDAPSTKKPLMIATLVYSGSVIADGITTTRFVRYGCEEAWSPYLYGRRPTAARFYAVSFGVEAVSVAVASRLIQKRSKLVRAVGWSLLYGQAGGHFAGAINNLRIQPEMCQ